MFCTTDLRLTVYKLKKGKKQYWCTEVHVLYILSTEDIHTTARLEAPFTSSQSSVPPETRSPSFLESDRVLDPSRDFVKRSAVLSFVSTRPAGWPSP